MEKALDILLSIEKYSKKALEVIRNEKFQLLPPLLDKRQELITQLEKAASSDIKIERTVLHRIEKLESKMLGTLKNSTDETKHSIDTVSKGKTAVKSGYFKSKKDYEKSNRFLKRG